MARLHPVAFTRVMMESYRPAALHWHIGDALKGVEVGAVLRLMIFCPPRHGKSELVSVHFPPWYLGRHPDRHIIATSYGAELAAGFGRQARNVMLAPEYGAIFPGLRLAGDSAAAHRWDIEGQSGGYAASGVGGPITGLGADVLCIDDPIKNREEAESPTYREAVWEWYRSVARPRLQPRGAIVLILTRWHEDDLAGRLLKAESERSIDAERQPWTVMRLPAIAEPTDPLGRTPGAPLWPEQYDLAELEAIREDVGPRAWAALYQQSPRPEEGYLFRREWFELVQAAPKGTRARFWDLATSESADADWTVGALLCRDANGLTYIEDIVRVRERPAGIEAALQTAALRDGQETTVIVEEEHGAAGKNLIDHLQRHVLPHRSLIGIKPTGSKEVRAGPLSGQAEARHVKVVRAPWNDAFFAELEAFPSGAHDDQVDAAAGAYNWLALKAPGRPTASKPVFPGLRNA